MAKICPITNDKVLYLDCLECEEKICKKDKGGNKFGKKEQKEKEKE